MVTGKEEWHEKDVRNKCPTCNRSANHMTGLTSSGTAIERRTCTQGHVWRWMRKTKDSEWELFTDAKQG